MSWKYYQIGLLHRICQHFYGQSTFKVADWIADLCWRTSKNDRLLVASNLKILFGKTDQWCDEITREVYRNYGRYLIEYFAVHNMKQPQLIRQGYKNLLEAKRQGKGVIVLTAHLGNWELGSIFLRRMGFPISNVVLTHEDSRINRLYVEQRDRCDVSSIALGHNAMNDCLKVLRSGDLLGLIGDRLYTENGSDIYFGRGIMRLPRGPAILSIRSGAPIVPSFLIREGHWKFRFYFDHPIWPQRNHADESSVRSLMQFYATIIEGYVERYPEQWLMFQAARVSQ